MTSTNYGKHQSKNPIQRMLIENFYRQLLLLVDTVHAERIIDVGCGEGYTLARLVVRRANLTGIDISEQALGIACAKLPALDIGKGDIYGLHAPDASYDLVLCNEVLEHLTQPAKALRELRRVSKKYVLLSVPNEPWFRVANFVRGKNWRRWGNPAEHLRHWTRSQFIEFVATHGFTVTKILTPFPWILILAEKK